MHKKKNRKEKQYADYNLVSSQKRCKQKSLPMMMMNCFCGMVVWRKVFSLISSWDHCQRSSQSWICDMLWAGFEPKQNLSSGLVEWSCAVTITTTPQHHNNHYTMAPCGTTGPWFCYKHFFNWFYLKLVSEKCFQTF